MGIVKKALAALVCILVLGNTFATTIKTEMYSINVDIEEQDTKIG